MNFLKVFSILMLSLSTTCIEQGSYLGCFRNIFSDNARLVEDSESLNTCIESCYSNYFRFSFVTLSGKCICTNILSEQADEGLCQDCKNCDPNEELYDVYRTGALVNGQPKNFRIENISDTQMDLSWENPESFLEIKGFVVKAKVLVTYSLSKISDLEWVYSNDTYRVEVIDLHPATTYNFTVQALSPEEGAPSYHISSTKIGAPDHVPSVPQILERSGETMVIKIKPVENNNGPISSYLVIVSDADSVQTFVPNYLKGFELAKAAGLSYYTTAEIQPTKINESFTIGNKQFHGKYYNAPLEVSVTYNVMIGVVSRLEGEEKVVFGETMMRFPVEGTSSVVIVLSVAIAIISCLLICAVIAFILLRRRIHIRHLRMQRLRNVQELTVQGPVVDMENSGFISDNDEYSRHNHYENLYQHLWTIPSHLLAIDQTSFLGLGAFGRVHSGTILQDNLLKPVAIYTIADKSLHPEDRKRMLRNMDLLIQSQKNTNIIELIGNCEKFENISVVLEYVSNNFKELLLNARVFGNDKFSNVSESQMLRFCIDICNGMDYLHSRNIVHKELCAAHIGIVNGSVAKICGFGLSKYYKTDSIPDVTRFAAREVFQGQAHNIKTDVWSFGCLLWETCSLGATLYGNLSNDELPNKIIKGYRLRQLPYVEDCLYQIMLNCWQLDSDERPNFMELVETLRDIKQEKYLNFNLYEGFQYEPYYYDMETRKSD